MGIKTSESSIQSLEELAKSLQATVDARQNTVTVLNADIIRLKELVVAENYTIGEQVKRKTELDSQVEKLEAQVASLTNSAIQAQDELDGTLSDLKSLKSEINIATEEKDKANRAISDVKVELTTKERELDSREKKLNALEEDLGARSSLVADKENHIKELIAKIK